ncbi:unnamed protein product [Penicillium glandicola]
MIKTRKTPANPNDFHFEPHATPAQRQSLKCVYGRSRRKGKPPSKKTAFVHQALHSSRVSISPDLPAPAPQSSAIGPNHHQHNYNHSCSWYRSMFNHSTPTEWERRTPHSSTHQSLPDEDAGTSHLPTSFTWPHMAGSDPMTDGDNLEEHNHSDYNDTRARSNESGGGQERDEVSKNSEDRYRQHEPCIAIACRTLSSLYQFIQSDCGTGHTTNENQSHNIPTPTTKESPNDIVFRMTRSATETVSRLLNCTSRCCAQDPSILLVLDSILLKILTWYEALYRSGIGELGLPDTVREDVSLRHSNTGQSGTHSTGLLQKSGRTMESMYTVSLTIPLTIGAFNLSPATETKMKAQLLLCEVHTLAQVCQVLGRRVQAAESIPGEENLCGQPNTHLLRKVSELQRALTVVCTQVPSLE